MLAAISILKWSLDFVCKQGGITKSKEQTPGGSDGKESACNAGDPGLIPGLERSHGKGNGNHSCILSWGIPGQRSLAGYSSWGCKRVR